MAGIPELIKGYVRIRLTSGDPERFLNLCAANKILLWDLLYTEHGYEMNLSAGSFFALKPLCRKSGSRIRLLEKHGLPFFFLKSGKRKAFFLGAAAGLLLVFTLSCFIWNIHVEGNYANSTAAVLECLKENEITHGILKRKVHTAEIASLLRREFSNITWVSAKIEGTQLILEIKENVDGYPEEKKEPENKGPTSLVAAKDGTVTSIVTRSGTPLTEAGKACKKGDVLVSGELEILNDSREVQRCDYVNADADIKIRTSYSYYDEFPLEHTARKYQETARKDWFFQLFEYRIYPLRSPGGSRQKRDLYTRTVPVKLTENFYLPLFYGYTQVNSYENVQALYTKEEAEALAQKHLKEFSENLEEKGVQIIQKNVKIEVTGTKCTTKGELIVNEEAVISAPCEISETLPGKDTAENE